MNRSKNGLTEDEQKKPIVLSLGDDDELDFKPITKGLGFHQNVKKPTPTRSQGIMSRSISAASATQKIPQVPALSSTPTQTLSAASSLPQELKAFYETPSAKEEVASVKNLKVAQPFENTHIKASPITQLGAWLVDLIVIGVFVSFTMAALFFVLGIELSQWREVILADNNYVVPLCMFSIYYILYFGVLDLVGGVGKTLMGIKVISRVRGEKLSFLKTALRAVISLLSLSVFGLPHIVDFQGKLSDTEVVSE